MNKFIFLEAGAPRNCEYPEQHQQIFMEFDFERIHLDEFIIHQFIGTILTEVLF